MATIKGAVIIDWQLSSYFRWGVCGINLMLNWPRGPDAHLLTQIPVDEPFIDLGPVEWRTLAPALQRSRELQAQLMAFRGQTVRLNVPLLHGLGNDFIGTSNANGVTVSGSPDLGMTCFESTTFSQAGRERAKAFRVIVAGSSWNRDVLEQAGIGPVAFVPAGIDPTAFHPAPQAGWFAGRFTVFSGGKLEYRKGQDLVLKAFRIFAARHADALLVTAWVSPWPAAARTLDADPTLAPVRFTTDGRLDPTAWAVANGIAAEQFIDLGAVANGDLARIYREMDVCLFPSRCEGGTNSVAMECLACGLPVILSRNTGHLDLVRSDRCFPLERQTPIGGPDRAGWGESNVEEIVETLEAVRADPVGGRVRGERAARFMRSMTWRRTAEALTDAIAPYLTDEPAGF